MGEKAQHELFRELEKMVLNPPAEKTAVLSMNEADFPTFFAQLQKEALDMVKVVDLHDKDEDAPRHSYKMTIHENEQAAKVIWKKWNFENEI